MHPIESAHRVLSREFASQHVFTPLGSFRNGGVVMRLRLLFVAMLIFVISPGTGNSQGLSDHFCGPARVTFGAQAGFQHMSLNVSLPTRPVLGNGAVDSIDLRLQDANMWVGSIDAGARIAANLYLFVKAEANAPRTVDVITSATDISAVSTFAPYRWSGSGLQWWALDGGAAYRFAREWSVLAGIRRDRLSVKMVDPVDQSGNPVNLTYQITPGFPGAPFGYGGERAAGDVQANFWLPYVGIRVDHATFRFSAIWSPFASAWITLPQRFISFTVTHQTTNPIVYTTQGTSYDFDYRVTSPAAFLEGNFEYNVNPAGMFRAKVWLKGSWLAARGRGSVHACEDTFNNQPTPVHATLTDSAGETGNISRAILAYGISAAMSF